MVDSIEEMCVAVSYLHSAIKKIARQTGIDVDDLLEESDRITARVRGMGYELDPSAVQSTQHRPELDNRRPHRPVYLRVVK